MTYIGNTSPSRFSSVPAVQRFSGNNSTTAFTLSTAIGSEQEILVSVDGVIQDTANYTVSGTTLTFSPAPSAGTNNIFVFTLSRAIASVTHPSTSALSATSGTFSGNVSVGGDLDVTGSLDMSDANLTNVGSIQLDSIAGDADTNTTIAFPGSDIITLGTSGSERVRINASGNVGIGIASPDGKVHIHTATAGSVAANAAADELVLENSGDAGLTILSPNANNSQILLGSPVAIAGGILRWTGDDNAVKIGTNNSGGTLRFHVGGFSEVMRINSSGNVGIGTSSPAVPSGTALEIYGASASRLKLSNSTTGTGATDGFQIYTSGSSAIIEQKENAEMRFYTNGSERVRIDASGNVGIGTTSPAYQLTLSSNQTYWEAGFQTTVDGGNQTLKIISDAHGGGGRTGDIRFYTNNTSSERMRIHSGGVVSIPGGIELGSALDATAANTLDDYEEGTWTPQIYAGADITTSNINAQYTKVGRVVHLQAQFKRGSSSGGSNTLEIRGFPFTNVSSSAMPGVAWIDNTGTDLRTLLYMGPGETRVYFTKTGATSAYVSINEMENGRWIYMSVTYSSA